MMMARRWRGCWASPVPWPEQKETPPHKGCDGAEVQGGVTPRGEEVTATSIGPVHEPYVKQAEFFCGGGFTPIIATPGYQRSPWVEAMTGRW